MLARSSTQRHSLIVRLHCFMVLRPPLHSTFPPCPRARPLPYACFSCFGSLGIHTQPPAPLPLHLSNPCADVAVAKHDNTHDGRRASATWTQRRICTTGCRALVPCFFAERRVRFSSVSQMVKPLGHAEGRLLVCPSLYVSFVCLCGPWSGTPGRLVFRRFFFAAGS